MIRCEWQCTSMSSQRIAEGWLMMLIPIIRWADLKSSIKRIQIRQRCFTFNRTDSMKSFCTDKNNKLVFNYRMGNFHFNFRPWRFNLPIPMLLGNPFGTNNVFKFVSPSKLAVVMKHFPSGSDDFNNTKSHGTSQSLDALTKSPCRISSHLISISSPFRSTVAD